MKTDDSLSNVFGVETIPSKVTEVITADGEVISASTNKIEDDYDHARNNLRLLLLDGQAALQTALAVAQSSEHPRAFEVLAKLMDTMLQANKDLMELQKQIRDIDAKDAPINNDAKNVTNNLFVGSTADLQKVIEKMKNGGTEEQ